MKQSLLIVCTLFLFQSCIPLRIAPTIEDYKITRGKKFKRSLPERQMFIFEDAKEAEQFYNFVNTKFQLDDTNVYDDVPFEINDAYYFFSWYEIEIPDKTLNLAPVFLHLFVGAALGNDDPLEDYDGEGDTVRSDNWYIALEVYSDLEQDCLADGSLSREAVLKYLRALKKEYLATHNYNETVFKN